MEDYELAHDGRELLVWTRAIVFDVLSELRHGQRVRVMGRPDELGFLQCAG